LFLGGRSPPKPSHRVPVHTWGNPRACERGRFAPVASPRASCPRSQETCEHLPHRVKGWGNRVSPAPRVRAAPSRNLPPGEGLGKPGFPSPLLPVGIAGPFRKPTERRSVNLRSALPGMRGYTSERSRRVGNGAGPPAAFEPLTTLPAGGRWAQAPGARVSAPHPRGGACGALLLAGGLGLRPASAWGRSPPPTLPQAGGWGNPLSPMLLDGPGRAGRPLTAATG